MFIIRNFASDDEQLELDQQLCDIENEYDELVSDTSKKVAPIYLINSVLNLLFKAFIIDKKLEHIFLDKQGNIKNKYRLTVIHYDYADSDNDNVYTIYNNYIHDLDLTILPEINLNELVTPTLDKILELVIELSMLK